MKNAAISPETQRSESVHRQPENTKSCWKKLREYFQWLWKCLCSCVGILTRKTTTTEPTHGVARTQKTDTAGKSHSAGATAKQTRILPDVPLLSPNQNTCDTVSGTRLNRWLAEYVLTQQDNTEREDFIITLANALNTKLDIFIKQLRKIASKEKYDSNTRRAARETYEELTNKLNKANSKPIECSGKNEDRLNEYLIQGQTLASWNDYKLALEQIFLSQGYHQIPNDIRYYIGDSTQTIKPAAGKTCHKLLPLAVTDERDPTKQHKLEVRFQQGDIVDHAAFLGCNIMFNPSNRNLGLTKAGGAEGAIQVAVGVSKFMKSTTSLIIQKEEKVNPGFVGAIPAGNLEDKGIKVVIHQVAPIKPESGDKQNVQNSYELLVKTWLRAFIKAGQCLQGERAQIVSTALGAGVFGWSPEESLRAAKTALTRLNATQAKKITSLVIIDPLAKGKNARGKSEGDAVLEAFKKVFSNDETTPDQALSSTTNPQGRSTNNEPYASTSSYGRGRTPSPGLEAPPGKNGDSSKKKGHPMGVKANKATRKFDPYSSASLADQFKTEKNILRYLVKPIDPKNEQLAVASEAEIRSLPNDYQDPITREQLNDMQKGHVLKYKPKNGRGDYLFISAQSYLDIYLREGQFVCPTESKRTFGRSTGPQPDSMTMTTETRPESLKGYPKCGHIIITYKAKDGIQGLKHQNPGKPYTAHRFPRVAYLPNNKEGKEILKLLETAFFDRKKVFTVGSSLTSGLDNVITWNEIHHKTSKTGQYGYPDLGYLDRVRAELKAKGIE